MAEWYVVQCNFLSGGLKFNSFNWQNLFCDWIAPDWIGLNISNMLANPITTVEM